MIGGALRSRRLLPPPQGVRPTSDRVRESLFARLGDVAGARVLDLFAGTGALSIEALSRGASFAVLIDRAASSLEVARRNVEQLDLDGVVRRVRGEVPRVLHRLGSDEPFDLVFLDPPYEAGGSEEVLVALQKEGLLAPEAVVVVEGPKRHSLAPPGGLVVTHENTYGDTRVTILARVATTESGA